MSFDNSVLPAPGMGSIAGINATSFAGYSSSGVMYANDVVPRFTRGTSPSITVSDPANDVAGKRGQRRFLLHDEFPRA
jgi:hypothetical protein